VNNGDQALHFIYLLGVLVLVASAFGVRRMPIGQGLKIAGAWLLIFAAAFAVFALKDEFTALGRRIVGGDGPQMVQSGETLRIRKGEDGHFWLDAKLNGKEAHLMVDSGATVTTLSSETARRSGIVPSDALKTMVTTANGVVLMRRGRVERFAVGDIVREDFPVHLTDSDETDVVGMNFLSTLGGWAVEGDWLVLQP
jgi:aspartyl protease family protein